MGGSSPSIPASSTAKSPSSCRAATAARGRNDGRVLDVTDDRAVLVLAEEIEESVGPIDVLIANAGYGLPY
ncbi:hypothetical protein [Actinoplanes utahensis]|uniref:Short-chain dehydrogenase n=1 Tax=Actinoplanes utahensis TaxID=1869 RepID=A0A0A6UFL2_ACTUT|nr:hypothetical protein MB27_26590 [Actinoplanes utahensis]GIF35196.1 hypothetical protein Aut01nite_81820 [Actinoplanes utahensis]